MTFAYGETSKSRLITCRAEIQRVMNRAADYVNIAIMEGARSDARQIELYAMRVGRAQERVTLIDGVTQKSKHQVTEAEPLSKAVDFVPWPQQYSDRELMVELGRFIVGLGAGMGIELRWGGDWNGNFDRTDQRFHDLPHIELIGD